MSWQTIILVALYVPVTVFAVLGVVRFGTALVRLVRKGEFRRDQHLMWVALVLLLTADALENIYYGIARISPAVYSALGHMVSAVLPMKLLILSALIVTVAAWCEIRLATKVLVEAAVGALVLWGVTAAVIYFVVNA